MRTIVVLAVLAWAGSAPAIVVMGAEETHARAPAAQRGFPAFPYWDHVVSLGNYSAVYLGERWVLTAGHVGVGDVEIRGKRFAAEPDTEIDLRTGFYSADLVLFRLKRDPGLASLAISAERPVLGEEALLLGWGRSGGDPVVWQGKRGRYWATGPPRLRWGRNRVSRLAVRAGTRGGYHTENFAVRFDVQDGSAAQSQAAQGDSGGAAFLYRDGAWELGGILLMIQRHASQPGNAAISGNLTFAADLSVYLDQIAAITGLGTAGN